MKKAENRSCKLMGRNKSLVPVAYLWSQKAPPDF